MTPGAARSTAPAAGRRLRILLYTVAALVVLTDQVTKQIAVGLLEGGPRIAVLGELAGFRFLRNDGAAFGMGSGATWIFTVIASCVFVAILFAGRRLGARSWAWALGLLLGGLTGNLIDRLVRPPALFHGAVVDFIDLYFFVCNVADIAITGAAVVLIIASFRGIGLDGLTDADREHQDAAGPQDGPGPLTGTGDADEEQERRR